MILWRDGLAGDWRTLLSEELYKLHTSPNISRVIAATHMECVGEMTDTEFGREKPEGKRQLGRPRCR